MARLSFLALVLLTSLSLSISSLLSVSALSEQSKRHPSKNTKHSSKSKSPRIDALSLEARNSNVSIAERTASNSWSYALQDSWKGSNFFEGWNFYDQADPTNGIVNFLDQLDATKAQLAYVQSNGQAVMKVDSNSNLANGVQRNSVRITSKKSYEGGLFVLDAAQFPYGCAVWPAFWMFGPNWPTNGEIDIFEGINLISTNQYTAHTSPGCTISSSPPASFAVSPSAATIGGRDCGPSANNAGCDYVDTNAAGASFGAGLNANGGAVLATEWTADGIKIWNFPRNHVPYDLTHQRPTPTLWPTQYLKAAWSSTSCPAKQYFNTMSMVFDITLCGDWAGTAYPSSGCPGTCQQQVMTGANFANAVWKINSVAVYT